MIKLVSTNRAGKFMRQLTQAQKNCLNETGLFLVDKMRHYVAKDTRYLESRCDYVINKNELFLHNDAHYAIHQEYGTRYQSGTPFFRPAAYNHKNELKAIAVKHYKKAGI